MENTVLIARFLITFILSSIFGIERQYSHKPIGFGTFTSVATGACAMAVTSMVLDVENPLPLLSGVITGIGFLGAGALIKTTDKIFGFTTAASIWAFAIFGLIIGVGEYYIGLSLYITIWLIVGIDRSLKIFGIGSYQGHVFITANRLIRLKELTAGMDCRKHKVISFEMDKKKRKYLYSILVEGTKKNISKIPEKLKDKKWLDSIKIE